MSKLYCSKSGQGPNLVLLHGWGSSSKIWHEVIDALGMRHRVWCIDLPGHGHSHAMHWDTGIESGMQALAEVLPGTASLLGWSLGGLWALLYALRYPQRVERVMLVSSAPRFTVTQDWPQAMAPAALQDFSRQFEEAPRQTLQKFCALQTVDSERAKATLLALRKALSAAPDPTVNLAWGLRWLERVDVRSDPGLMRMPIDILHGEQDRVLPIETAEATARIWSHARIERVTRAGHAPFVSHPQQFVKWVDRIHE